MSTSEGIYFTSSLFARVTPTLLAASLFIPVTYFAFSKLRSSRRPPQVGYFIPWVGSALSIGRDSDGFFEDAQNKYGPMFRVLTFGSEAIYVTSPTLINDVYKDQETFVFIPVRLEMSYQIFGLSHSVNYSSYMKGDYFAMHHHALSPKAIPAVLNSYHLELYRSFKTALSNVPQKSGRTRLRTLLLPPAYEAASRAFVGPEFPALDTFGAFLEFDKAFPLLAIGAPNFVVSRAKMSWDMVVDAVNQHLSTSDYQHNASELVTSTVEGWSSHGYGQIDAARVIATDLWAINANAIWAAYWIIALHLTQRPEGLKILVAEIDASRRTYAAKLAKGTSMMDDPAAINDWLSSSSATMPLLNSTIQETLRYCSSSSSIRLVTRDTVLGDKEIRKGERIICPSRPIHLDEEVHEFANQYEPARYMDTTVARTKDGKRVNNHTMPFGGGVSMCEGRHFAQAELRAFVALLLTMMNIELDPKSDLRPKFEMQRVGLGIFHAEGDLDVHVSPRVLT